MIIIGDQMSVKLNFNQHGDNAPFYVYSHWGKTSSPVTLANALDRGRTRWSDESYLARIIASDFFVDAGPMSMTTGAGIAPYAIETVVWEVDFKNRTVTAVEGWTHLGQNLDGSWTEEEIFYEGETLSFDAFIEKVRDHPELRGGN